MPVLTEENLETLIAHASGNCEVLSQPLSQCFDRGLKLDVGDSRPLSDGQLPGEFDGPGLIALFQLNEQAVVVLVPSSLPLPDWYISPNDSQKARLETLAMEWSFNLFPSEMEVTKYGTRAVLSLSTELRKMVPAEWAAVLELPVFSGGGISRDPQSRLMVVWPLTQPEFGAPGNHTPATLGTGTKGKSQPAPVTVSAPTPAAHAVASSRMTIGADRLKFLPVNVSVRLAEKRIPLVQLLKISAGSLIMFDKSCEDLLDLYVNNAIYARGEAVKIGENFGLKVNQVAVKPDQRESNIVQ